MSDAETRLDDDEPFDLEREPLDQPEAFEIDWGGNGSDLTRPVRAHVLAALRPTTEPYEPPLDELLTLGELSEQELEHQLRALKIGQQHVPELLRMARDRALNTATSDTPEVWAPYLAFALLSRLDLSAQVPELIPLFDVDFDRVGDELIGMLAAVGAPALAPLRTYLGDRTRWAWGRARAADALQELVERYPEHRDVVVAGLSDVLTGAEADHEVAISAVVSTLVGLRASEALPLIRRAFELGKVDETIDGPWGTVLERFGVEPDPDDPLLEESERRFEERQAQLFPAEMLAQFEAEQDYAPAEPAREQQRATPQKRKQAKARKAKNKRKTASASRKANKKKRK